MAHKPDDDPVKLIHILPSEKHSSRFRILIGTERVSHWMAGLAGWWSTILTGMRSLTRVAQWVQRQGRKAAEPLGTIIRFIKNGLFFLFQRTRQGGAAIRVSIAKMLHEKDHILKAWTNGKWQLTGKVEQTPVKLIVHETVSQNDNSKEVDKLRDQLFAQQKGLTRITTQVSELQALVLSQQQVLLHLGKELERTEAKAAQPVPTPSKKSKSRAVKPAKSKKDALQETPPSPPSA